MTLKPATCCKCARNAPHIAMTGNGPEPMCAHHYRLWRELRQATIAAADAEKQTLTQPLEVFAERHATHCWMIRNAKGVG